MDSQINGIDLNKLNRAETEDPVAAPQGYELRSLLTFVILYPHWMMNQ